MTKSELKNEAKPQFDMKDSKRDMISKAFMHLPQSKGTKKEIISKVESLYNLKLTKESSMYKTLSQ